MKLNVKRHAVVQPLDQSIKLIPLTKGQNAIVDATDYEWLMKWNWFAHSSPSGYYAVRNRQIEDGATTCMIPMHRQLTGHVMTDHKNLNTLDNRRENLRLCTGSKNQLNREKQCNNTSGFKGVSWHKRQQKWNARGSHCGKRIHLGTFATKEQAANAYREYVQKHDPDFMRL